MEKKESRSSREIVNIYSIWQINPQKLIIILIIVVLFMIKLTRNNHNYNQPTNGKEAKVFRECV